MLGNCRSTEKRPLTCSSAEISWYVTHTTVKELSKPFRPLYERIKSFEQRATFLLASNQAQPLLIWWRRDLGLGASKNRRICNHYVFKVVSQNLAYWQRVVYTWADVGPGAERHNSHWCTCMLTMLNSEKTLVLYVLRLGRFVSSMSWCLESALRRCELRHSVTLKAELRRSIEVVLAGHHFVADQLGFEKSLIYQLLPFALTTGVVACWYC